MIFAILLIFSFSLAAGAQDSKGSVKSSWFQTYVKSPFERTFVGGPLTEYKLNEWQYNAPDLDTISSNATNSKKENSFWSYNKPYFGAKCTTATFFGSLASIFGGVGCTLYGFTNNNTSLVKGGLLATVGGLAGAPFALYVQKLQKQKYEECHSKNNPAQ